MSAGIYITKTGFRLTVWDGEIRQYVDKPIRSILHHLREGCIIEDGVTLGQIIEHVGSNNVLAAIVGEMAWADVAAFRAEVVKPCAEPSDLKWIEISRHIEINADEFKRVTHIDDSLNVSGCNDEQNNWAIDFTPVNEMRDVPVKLNTRVQIRDWREIGEDGLKVIAEGDTWFSLLEVLTELFYEISFHGSPSDRNEKFGELLQAVEEVKNGTAETVPFKPLDETVQ